VVKNSAVFFDRDGVLNHAIVHDGKPFPPKGLTDFVIYDDALECMTRLKDNGFYIIVVTNQPDVKNGIQSLETMSAMHAILKGELPIDDIEVCFDEESEFYKPEPGMLLVAAKNYGINLGTSYMVGDRWRDMGAGKNAGCKRSILLDRAYNEPLTYEPDYICKTLTQATNYILNDCKET
jgi:D-glycero-D-manno-heptose 1,7-bisphosphate phosphatase